MVVVVVVYSLVRQERIVGGGAYGIWFSAFVRFYCTMRQGMNLQESRHV